MKLLCYCYNVRGYRTQKLFYLRRFPVVRRGPGLHLYRLAPKGKMQNEELSRYSVVCKC